MPRTSILIPLAVLMAGVSLAATDVAAQNRAVATAPAPAIDQDALDMKEMADQGMKLKADTEAALKSLEEKQATLSSVAKDTQGAQQFIDDMIGLLRDTAGRVGPDGAYMKTLQTQQDLLRQLAAEALSDRQTGSQAMGEQFNARAATIASLQAEARDLAAKLSAEIDRLEQSRPQVKYAYALKKADEFIATARAYLDTVKSVLQGTSSLATRSQNFARPPIPTN